MTSVIEVTGLKKRFGRTLALDGLDLTVGPGDVHGFIGPNGSGKSTTIRILLGLIRATGGTARIFGEDPWDRTREVMKRIAYVPGDVHLWPNLTGGETIDLLGSLRGGLDPERRRDLCERFELDTSKKAKAYSKGNRQKVALVAALASDADLFVFDEPTSGLDPLKEAVFHECVREIRTAGRTILLSSHILGQVEQLVDRLTIIREGRTVETGSLAEMRHLTRTSVRAETADAPDGIEGLEGLHELRREGNRVAFTVGTDDLGTVIGWLAQRRLVTLVSRPPTLEDLFLSRYEDRE